MDQRCLGRPVDVGLDAHLLQPLADVHEDLLEILLALGRPGRHHLLDLRVALGVQRGEGEVLELPAHLLHAQAVGERGVDVERLLRGAPLLPLRHHRERAHVVQPVGELDQQHPPVVRHGHEHLADGGGLLRLLGVELQAVELGDAVDHLGHAGPEGLADRLEREPGVLHGVVQEGGGHGLGVEAELGHDRRHGDGVGDVRLAGAAELPVVGRQGHPARRHDGGGVVLGPVAGELGQQRGQRSRSVRSCACSGSTLERPLFCVAGVTRARVTIPPGYPPEAIAPRPRRRRPTVSAPVSAGASPRSCRRSRPRPARPRLRLPPLARAARGRRAAPGRTGGRSMTAVPVPAAGRCRSRSDRARWLDRRRSACGAGRAWPRRPVELPAGGDAHLGAHGRGVGGGVPTAGSPRVASRFSMATQRGLASSSCTGPARR